MICQTYNINESDLLRSKCGVVNEPRNVAIYLTRRLTGDRWKHIAEHFGIEKYISVSSVIERMKASMVADKRLRKRIENLQSATTKSQEQT